MKVLEKISLAIFIVITFSISLIFIFAYFNILTVADIANGLNYILTQELLKTVFLAITIICVFLDILLLSSDDTERKPIVSSTERGILEIMPETIENIALIEVNNYASTQEVNTKMKMTKEGIVINVFCKVLPEANICDLARQLQDKIKDKIEKQTGATVKSVNLRIKDVKRPKEAKGTKED